MSLSSKSAVQAAVFVIALTSVASADLSSKIKIGDYTLVKNGSGVRTKTFVQLYESGLYLQKPSQDAKAIIAADQLMAIRVQITSGFVSRSALVSSLNEGLEKSTGGNLSSIRKETEMFSNLLKDEVKKNDIFDFVYIPSKGLYVVKNGKIRGTIEGMKFKQALFGIWLSDSPVDKKLRQAMLSSKVR